VISDRVKRQLATREPARVRADREIRPGDVRRASSSGETRLVVVLAVNASRESAQISLLHPYSEQATAADIVVDQSISGVNFPIVVQTAMRGVVWMKDLERLITELPAEVVSACLKSDNTTEFSSEGLSAGSTFGGPLDARAAFKNSERDSLARLCSSSTAAMLDGEAFALQVDEVFHALLAPSPDAGRMMSALVDLWLTRGEDLVFTLDHVDFLEGKGLLDIDRWASALGADGLAFRLGPLQLVIERAMARFGQSEPQPQSTLGERELIAVG